MKGRLIARTGAIVMLAGLCLCSAFAADTALAGIPFKREAAPSDVDFPRLVAGLLIVGCALAGSLYAVRRRVTGCPIKKTGSEPLLQVMESHRLAPRSTLHVVKFGDVRYLLAQSEQGINCIASAPADRDEKASQL